MTERCTLDGFVITPIEPQGSRYAGTDHGRLFINEARTGVMAWWSMGRWTDRAARETIVAHAMTMTLADFRRWFARHAASGLVDERGRHGLAAGLRSATSRAHRPRWHVWERAASRRPRDGQGDVWLPVMPRRSGSQS